MILAMDWVMDRARTTLNVLGDSVVAAMVRLLRPRHASVCGSHWFSHVTERERERERARGLLEFSLSDSVGTDGML